MVMLRVPTSRSNSSSTGGSHNSLIVPFVASVSSVALAVALLLASSPSSLSSASSRIADNNDPKDSEQNPIKSSPSSQGVPVCTLTDNTDNNHDPNTAIYHTLGVRPPHDRTKVLRLPWPVSVDLPLARWAWRLHGRLLPVLHAFEEHPPGDVFVNLRVVWCKLLFSLDPTSRAYEGIHAGNPQEKPSREPAKRCWLGSYATYRMLPPSFFKWSLRYLGLWRIFPRWMHANIELRTVYLQTALEKTLGGAREPPVRGTSNSEKGQDYSIAESNAKRTMQTIERVCVIVLGGGYDPRGAMLSTGWASSVEKVYELDLPAVVESKGRMLRRAGFEVATGECRHTEETSNNSSGVCLEGVDLNDDAAVDQALDTIRNELMTLPNPVGENFEGNNKFDTVDPSLAASADLAAEKPSRWRVVLISEAVLMYLDPGKAQRVLKGVGERFRGGYQSNPAASAGVTFHEATFVFADRLLPRKNKRDGSSNKASSTRTVPNTPDLIQAEESEVRQWLLQSGWRLKELLLKPGGTRHLGIATAMEE